MNIIFSNFPININSNFVLVLAENFDLSAIKCLNDEQQKFILEAIKLRKFEGKSSQEMRLVVPTIDSFKEVILLGIGSDKDFTELSALKLGGNIISIMKNLKIEKLSVILDVKLVTKNEKSNIANIAFGAKLRNYSFDKYKSADKLKNKVNIIEFELFCSDFAATESLFNRELDPIADSVYFSRDLASEPANIIYPDSFVQRAKEDLSKYDIKIEVLGEKEMQDLGMNALLGVGQGSSKDSKLLVMQYNGGEIENREALKKALIEAKNKYRLDRGSGLNGRSIPLRQNRRHTQHCRHLPNQDGTDCQPASHVFRQQLLEYHLGPAAHLAKQIRRSA